jgi:hypothetical protein
MSGKKSKRDIVRIGLNITFAWIVLAIIGGERFLLFPLFLLSAAVVQHPVLYLGFVTLLFIISIIGILRSDKNDNVTLFRRSAFFFCLSIIGGIFYLLSPAIYWFFTRD